MRYPILGILDHFRHFGISSLGILDHFRHFRHFYFRHFYFKHFCYMFRRYLPPTSYNAWVICPSVHTWTVSISSAKILSPDRTVFWRRSSIFGASFSFRFLNSPMRLSCDSFSASVALDSSTHSDNCPRSASGSRKVLTPTIGNSPVCFRFS